MFNATLRLDENSDLDSLLQSLSKKLKNSDLDDLSIASITSQSRLTASQFIEQGNNLLNVGSTLTANRSLSGDGYVVQIQARFGTKPSVLSRLLDRLLRRG